MADVIHGSTNVYADLDHDDAGEMLIKAQIVTKIRQIIAERKWSQQHAAEVIGLPRPKLSKMLNGQFRGISEAKLLECLTRLGRDVRIVVGPDRQTAETGRMDIVFT